MNIYEWKLQKSIDWNIRQKLFIRPRFNSYTKRYTITWLAFELIAYHDEG